MANNKKVTVSSVAAAIQNQRAKKDVLIIVNGDVKVEITVKKRLTLLERSNIVDSIASMVWIRDEDGQEVFAPYLRKFAYDFNIINYFTNISLPDDTEKVWEFIDSVDIVHRIIDFVGDGYVEGIIREANEEIDYRKEAALKRSKLDDVLGSLTNITRHIDDKTKRLDIGGILEMAEKYAPEFKENLEKLFRMDVPLDLGTAKDETSRAATKTEE